MQNKEKMERLAALSLLVLGIMLVFAVFDANRVNQRLSELQQTVDYGQQLEKLLFPNGGYPATAETEETAESAEKEMSEPVIDFTVTGDGIVPSEESFLLNYLRYAPSDVLSDFMGDELPNNMFQFELEQHLADKIDHMKPDEFDEKYLEWETKTDNFSTYHF